MESACVCVWGPNRSASRASETNGAERAPPSGDLKAAEKAGSALQQKDIKREILATCHCCEDQADVFPQLLAVGEVSLGLLDGEVPHQRPCWRSSVSDWERGRAEKKKRTPCCKPSMVDERS